jgi:hypothetical protein
VTLVKGAAFLGARPAGSDGDEIPDAQDSGLLVANPDQRATDADG